MAHDALGNVLEPGDQVALRGEGEYEVERIGKTRRDAEYVRLLGCPVWVKAHKVELVEKSCGIPWAEPMLEPGERLIGIRRYSKGYQVVRFFQPSPSDLSKSIRVEKVYDQDGSYICDADDGEALSKWVGVHTLTPGIRAQQDEQGDGGYPLAPNKPPQKQDGRGGRPLQAPIGGANTQMHSNPAGLPIGSQGAGEVSDGLPKESDPHDLSRLPFMERTDYSDDYYQKRTEQGEFADPQTDDDRSYLWWLNGCSNRTDDRADPDNYYPEVGLAKAEWDETKHPRDDHGRFGSGSGELTTESPPEPGKEPEKEGEFKPSPYQKAVFDWINDTVKKPDGALVVDAVAGSGKTTTMIQALRMIPKNQRVYFLSFNKSIALNLQKKAPSHVVSSTINSLGFAALRKAYPGVTMDNYKDERLVGNDILGGKSYDDASPQAKKLFDDHAAAIVDLVQKKKMYYSEDESGKPNGPDWEFIANKHKIEMPDDPDQKKWFLGVATRTLNKSIRMATTLCDDYGNADPRDEDGKPIGKRTCDFKDQVLIPALKHLPLVHPKTLEDEKPAWCMVDETQDLAMTDATLVKRLAPRTVVVGDPHQSIYLFKGADPSSMDKIQASLKADTRPLSICYRCPKSVIDEAKTIVPHIEAKDDAPIGTVDRIPWHGIADHAEPGSRVLCRTNAPLAAEAMNLIRNGKKAVVMGRDIGKDINKLVDRIARKAKTDDLNDFHKALNDFHEKETARLTASKKTNLLGPLDDKVETVHALSEGATSVRGIKANVDKVFSAQLVKNEQGEWEEQPSPGVTFSSIHKAKGLEAPHVLIMRPDLLPFPRATGEEELKQEDNLKYVAITRAQQRLTWVSPPPRTADGSPPERPARGGAPVKAELVRGVPHTQAEATSEPKAPHAGTPIEKPPHQPTSEQPKPGKPATGEQPSERTIQRTPSHITEGTTFIDHDGNRHIATGDSRNSPDGKHVIVPTKDGEQKLRATHNIDIVKPSEKAPSKFKPEPAPKPEKITTRTHEQVDMPAHQVREGHVFQLGDDRATVIGAPRPNAKGGHDVPIQVGSQKGVYEGDKGETLPVWQRKTAKALADPQTGDADITRMDPSQIRYATISDLERDSRGLRVETDPNGRARVVQDEKFFHKAWNPNQPRDDHGRFGEGTGTGNATIPEQDLTDPRQAPAGPHPNYYSSKKVRAQLASNYFDASGNKFQSSRQNRASTTSIKPGAWKIDDDYGPLLHGHDIEQLGKFNPRDLTPMEFDWKDPGQALHNEDRLGDSDRYMKWLKEGNDPPPIHVVESDKGELRVTDGHRRLYAHDRLGIPIKAWVSWSADHPQSRTDSEGRIMKVGLTHEIAQTQGLPKRVRPDGDYTKDTRKGSTFDLSPMPDLGHYADPLRGFQKRDGGRVAGVSNRTILGALAKSGDMSTANLSQDGGVLDPAQSFQAKRPKPGQEPQEHIDPWKLLASSHGRDRLKKIEARGEDGKILPGEGSADVDHLTGDEWWNAVGSKIQGRQARHTARAVRLATKINPKGGQFRSTEDPTKVFTIGRRDNADRRSGQGWRVIKPDGQVTFHDTPEEAFFHTMENHGNLAPHDVAKALADPQNSRCASCGCVLSLQELPQGVCMGCGDPITDATGVAPGLPPLQINPPNADQDVPVGGSGGMTTWGTGALGGSLRMRHPDADLAKADWEEAKHPRDARGRFGSGGGELTTERAAITHRKTHPSKIRPGHTIEFDDDTHGEVTGNPIQKPEGGYKIPVTIKQTGQTGHYETEDDDERVPILVQPKAEPKAPEPKEPDKHERALANARQLARQINPNVRESEGSYFHGFDFTDHSKPGGLAYKDAESLHGALIDHGVTPDQLHIVGNQLRLVKPGKSKPESPPSEKVVISNMVQKGIFEPGHFRAVAISLIQGENPGTPGSVPTPGSSHKEIAALAEHLSHQFVDQGKKILEPIAKEWQEAKDAREQQNKLKSFAEMTILARKLPSYMHQIEGTKENGWAFQSKDDAELFAETASKHFGLNGGKIEEGKFFEQPYVKVTYDANTLGQKGLVNQEYTALKKAVDLGSKMGINAFPEKEREKRREAFVNDYMDKVRGGRGGPARLTAKNRDMLREEAGKTFDAWGPVAEDTLKRFTGEKSMKGYNGIMLQDRTNSRVGGYNAGYYMMVTPNRSSIQHEFGHSIEDYAADPDTKSMESRSLYYNQNRGNTQGSYWSHRVMQKDSGPIRSLGMGSLKGRAVQGKPDKWGDPYSGRIYGKGESVITEAVSTMCEMYASHLEVQAQMISDPTAIEEFLGWQKSLITGAMKRRERSF